MKTCTKCGAEKELTDFYKDKSRKDGLFPQCKVCQKEDHKIYYDENKEEIKSKVNKYREENPDIIRKRKEKYYQDNRESISEKNKENYKKDPEYRERCLASSNQWYSDNHELGLERSRKWRKNNPGATTDQLRAWKAKYPDRYKAAKVNDAAKRRMAGCNGAVKLTEDQLHFLMESQKGLCFYCSVILTKPYHVDHKIPLSRGGGHVLKNWCLSCPSCNLSKHDKTDEEFIASRTSKSL